MRFTGLVRLFLQKVNRLFYTEQARILCLRDWFESPLIISDSTLIEQHIFQLRYIILNMLWKWARQPWGLGVSSFETVLMVQLLNIANLVLKLCALSLNIALSLHLLGGGRHELGSEYGGDHRSNWSQLWSLYWMLLVWKMLWHMD